MNIVLSLDYEVFFGRQGGSVQRTLIEPTEALCELALRYRVPLVFFVDATWLVRLRQEAARSTSAMAEHYRVARQLETLAGAGHELQLHLHPHWRDTHWRGDGWEFDLRRYRLHDFSDAEIGDIVGEGVNALRAFSGSTPVTAFRAGGWCIQPFDRLRPALLAHGIRIDSTVYAGGRQEGVAQAYDFSQAPEQSHWFFDDDPLRARPDGDFLELPIASHDVSPLFYWRMAATKVGRSASHRQFGDGAAVPLSRGDLARKLLQRSASVVSVDGLKASFLGEAFDAYRRRRMSDFVIIGHPKAFTRYSLERLELFLHEHRNQRFVGLGAYQRLLRGKPAIARAA